MRGSSRPSGGPSPISGPGTCRTDASSRPPSPARRKAPSRRKTIDPRREHERGAVTSLLSHRPCTGSEYFCPREGAKVGRRQDTFWLAANRKGPETPATVLKPLEP